MIRMIAFGKDDSLRKWDGWTPSELDDGGR